MAQIHIKEKTTVEGSVVEEQGKRIAECSSCSQINKDHKDLVHEADCAGEWTRAVAYIYAPAYQNMLVIPSATSLADAVNKTRRCGGDPTHVWFYSSPVVACAPYIRCNL
jgi:hypothetical protein